jgi:hypothetical protein
MRRRRMLLAGALIALALCVGLIAFLNRHWFTRADPHDIVFAQQVADLKYKPPIPRPVYEAGEGPRVAIDEAHHNFHTAQGRYKPFAELLRRDGYRVDALRQLFSAESLKSVEILVISNALNERNAEDWSPPNPSAFTSEEVDTVHRWVEKGGSLFLIADHAPFPGAATDLAKSFGVEFCNGYATAGHWKSGGPETFEYKTGLKESAITRGRSDEEKVTKVMTFTGSAFRPPTGATPVLVFGAKSEAVEMTDGEPGKPNTRTVPIEGWCQGAVMKVGKGRVAVFGEAAMFSAQLAGPRQPMGMNAPGAEQNHQLLLNVMHWLSRAKRMADQVSPAQLRGAGICWVSPKESRRTSRCRCNGECHSPVYVMTDGFSVFPAVPRRARRASPTRRVN